MANTKGEPKLTKSEADEISILEKLIIEFNKVDTKGPGIRSGVDLAIAVTEGQISGIKAHARWREGE